MTKQKLTKDRQGMHFGSRSFGDLLDLVGP